MQENVKDDIYDIIVFLLFLIGLCWLFSCLEVKEKEKTVDPVVEEFTL